MLQSSVQAAASAGVEPPWKKWKPNPSPPSFLSLPDVIILHCLARISKSYHPKLSLVSKTFRSLILSTELGYARFPTVLVPRGSSSGCNPRRRKLHLCSSYAPRVPLLVLAVGSDVYALRQGYRPSQAMFVRNRENILWSNAPNMTVARVNPAACVLDGKIYVVGGCCEAAAKSCWGEVFDTKTRTWETLPDPGDELRFSSMIKKLEIIRGKVYVTSNEGEGDSVYDPKTRTWKAIGKRLEGDSRCWVGSLHYSCRRESCMWYDKECKEWKHVKGLSSFNKSCRRGGLIETVQFCPKLLILWDKFAPLRGDCEEKTICCALVAFEKRKNGHVWGKVEWSSPVLTVPSSYLFLRSGGIRT
ncbi:hypothetical protein IGI04_041969 [Brassica rapa subsp. trilocularis]|uniref:F-box domain-containing protein n=2 Tax=Brassica TaxID=3705 RepID=A0ABQ8BT29_BRANA|nr:hypothetical protein IGI04_041969 [Brassica rapa subsp. trilocularis]KAH0907919.1 hypothetical protein HID58_039746 [Brassica napus]